MSKKITLELNDETFAWLEVLVVALAKDNLSEDEYRTRIAEMSRKEKERLALIRKNWKYKVKV